MHRQKTGKWRNLILFIKIKIPTVGQEFVLQPTNSDNQIHEIAGKQNSPYLFLSLNVKVSLLITQCTAYDSKFSLVKVKTIINL